MKYYPRLKVWKASNLMFREGSNLAAYSYEHWRFLSVTALGRVVFNQYKYSQTTSRHQKRVLAKLAQLGIKVDIFLNIPQSLPHTEYVPWRFIVDAQGYAQRQTK